MINPDSLLKEIHYNDSISDLASVMEQVGTRRFLADFRHNYPKHFEEMSIQITRLDQRQIPALLKKDTNV
jgi:hypothetical protein